MNDNQRIPESPEWEEKLYTALIKMAKEIDKLTTQITQLDEKVRKVDEKIGSLKNLEETFNEKFSELDELSNQRFTEFDKYSNLAVDVALNKQKLTDMDDNVRFLVNQSFK